MILSQNEDIEKKNNKLYRRGILLSVCLVLIITLSIYCSHNWFQLMIIQGDSMLPTYHHLQLTLLDKRDVSIERGNVVAFCSDYYDAVLLKRVAAVPGDLIVIEEGHLFVNGQISKEFENVFFEYAGILSAPIKLYDNEYIMIGDNVSVSKDSRYSEIGAINKDCIIGKVIGP